MKFCIAVILFLLAPIVAWSEAKLSLNKDTFNPHELIQIQYTAV
jgi:hypothetical protein